MLTYFLMLPFGMASDGCGDDDPGYLCNGGDSLFALLPPIGFVSALGSSVPAAAVLSRLRMQPDGRRLSPVWGLAVGVLMWWLVPFTVWHAAIAVYHGP